jgi:quercetin dioxygenase-like cupin family protein
MTGALLRVVVITMLGLVGSAGAAMATAQDSTPASEEESTDEGVAYQFIGYGMAETLPSPAELSILRLTLDPGAQFGLDPADPAVALVVVESGAATFMVDAEITVLHAPAEGEMFSQDFEVMPANETFTMEAGASAVFPNNVGGELRNEGDEPLSILVADITPSDTDAGATPEG